MADVQMEGQVPEGPVQGVDLVVQSSSGLDYQLHPLVLINISDHTVRTRSSGSRGYPRVIGCLLGQHFGRCVDISNSFEMLATSDADSLDFDRDLLEQKRSQYGECFKSLDVIGWYATGPELTAQDLQLHKKFMEATEAPIFLLMDPQAACTPGAKDLPVSVYESAVHVVHGSPQTLFAKAAYGMATSDAERIGVNTAANVMPTGASGDKSALAQHYTSLHSALKMLAERVEHLLAYVVRMQAGAAPLDHQCLRKVAAVLDKVPTMASDDFQSALMTECTDVALVNMLCLMTRGVDTCHQLVDLSSVAYPSRR